MKNLYIGLMSGTSIDGVDAALINFSDNQHEIIATSYTPFPIGIREAIQSLCSPGDNEIERMGKVDNLLGVFYANCIERLLQQASIKHDQVIAIGSHGQTIRHRPDSQYPFTHQIGDPNQIAYLTGITTVADFRRRDMAAGGQGAPLAPLFHQQLFQKDNEPVVVVNLGGIANITVISESFETFGFDTGPANNLLDLWAETNINTPYDKDGQWARSGTVIKPLLERMLQENYFKREAPKSTGRELFNKAWLSQHLSHFETHKPEDIQATLAELTAVTVADAINSSSPECETIILCGGGAYNTYLVERIRANTTCKNIRSTSHYGIDPDWIEAAAFAWLAKRTLEGRYGNLPSVTGAETTVVLGGIYPGRNWPDNIFST